MVKWSAEALRDVGRLHAFLKPHSAVAASKVVGAIRTAAGFLGENPGAGRPMNDERREWFARFGAGAYVLRYRLTPAGEGFILRVWHTRELR